MASLYLWVKALHVIAVIAWMAGMLYLPRLFVYHTRAEKGGEWDKTLQLMEKKLLRVIMNPALCVTVLLGIVLVFVTDAYQAGWFHVKMACFLGMLLCHGFMAKYRRCFAEGHSVHSERFFRMFNEMPALLMVIMVILAVVKPF